MSKVIRNICGGNLINPLVSVCAFEKIKERLKSLRKEDSAQKRSSHYSFAHCEVLRKATQTIGYRNTL